MAWSLFGKKKTNQKCPTDKVDIKEDGHECPIHMKYSNVCVCSTCSKKTSCPLEKLSRSTECTKYFKFCSCKDPQSNDETVFPKLVLEEYMDYIGKKYMGDYNGTEN